MKKLTKKQHKEVHVKLHRALDELFADYISHHRKETNFLEMPFEALLNWSFEQTKNPADDT